MIFQIYFLEKYLEGLDLFFEKLLKKYFTILSSIEWKVTKIFPLVLIF